MSSRSALRRKVVLPVTIIRCNGREKQLAHTLDLTETSARLGGLTLLLEPGEVIEIQRGAVRAKFQVFWMGSPGSAMAGQAGVRSLEPNKSVWGVTVPSDETDLNVDTDRMRDTMPPVRSSSQFPGEKRWHPRFPCSGGVSIKTTSAAWAIHGEIKDLSKGGIYVEMVTPLPVNTQVSLNLEIEGIGLETTGIVRTSYPLVGMGISFTNLSAQNQERVARMINRIQQAKPEEGAVSAHSHTATPAVRDTKSPLSPLRLDAYPVRILAAACENLAADFDRWKSTRSADEIEQLREAINQLHQKLSSPVPQIELLDYFSITASHGGHA
jgi:hypothetical protein